MYNNVVKYYNMILNINKFYAFSVNAGVQCIDMMHGFYALGPLLPRML